MNIKLCDNMRKTVFSPHQAKLPKLKSSCLDIVFGKVIVHQDIAT